MTASEPIRIAVAVVQCQGQVLIGQRPPEVPLAGYWEFPGGKILPDETAEEAAIRECREETGLDVCIVRSLAVVDHRYEHAAVRLHFFLAEPVLRGLPQAPPFRWVPILELANYQFPPANGPVLEELASRKEGS